MFVLKATLLAATVACACAQQGPTTTPVPILKQINRQNDDGSYSFGYEAADGSFKIETKYPNGDVAGKYGYVGEDGKLKEFSYGASSKRGFEPEGPGIQVPPPTLNDSPSNALTDGQEDDGQYREDPRIYEDPKYNAKGKASRPSANFQFHQPSQPEDTRQYQPTRYQQPQYQQPQYQQPQYQQQYQQPSQFRSSPLFSQQTTFQPQQSFSQPQFNQPRPQSQIYHQQPQFSYQAFTPQYSQYQYNPNQNYNPFLGHPAQNFDPSTGSYTIDFTGK